MSQKIGLLVGREWSFPPAFFDELNRRDAGVTALKIEGRQRSRAYIRAVVGAFRETLDALARGEPMPAGALMGLAEGQSATQGAYVKTWR